MLSCIEVTTTLERLNIIGRISERALYIGLSKGHAFILYAFKYFMYIEFHNFFLDVSYESTKKILMMM